MYLGRSGLSCCSGRGGGHSMNLRAKHVSALMHVITMHISAHMRSPVFMCRGSSSPDVNLEASGLAAFACDLLEACGCPGRSFGRHYIPEVWRWTGPVNTKEIKDKIAEVVERRNRGGRKVGDRLWYLLTEHPFSESTSARVTFERVLHGSGAACIIKASAPADLDRQPHATDGQDAGAHAAVQHDAGRGHVQAPGRGRAQGRARGRGCGRRRGLVELQPACFGCILYLVGKLGQDTRWYPEAHAQYQAVRLLVEGS